MKKVIEIKDLTKSYGRFEAVKGISFDVYKGEVFGLLGENGAGKTTTLEIIEGLKSYSGGEINVLEHNISQLAQIKEKIGIQLQSSAYYNFLTLKEILVLFGSFYSKSLPPLELLEMVDLFDKQNSYIGDLSGGQKQRFSIAASLINDPEIVFLDEPTTGLDPIARRNLWELVETIKARGKTIVLTTHYMEEAERLCDRIAIMEKGKILVIDTTANLLEMPENPHRLTFSVSSLSNSIKEKLAELSTLEENEGVYTLKMNNQSKLQEALKIIIPLGLNDLRVSHTTLEDLFIQLTGKQFESESTPLSEPMNTAKTK